MEAIDQGNSSIEKLFFTISLSSEDERTRPPLNLKPLAKLEEVSLNYNFLTEQELVNFFAALSPSTKLRKLDIGGLLWPAEGTIDGSTEVLAKAINFLEVVHLYVDPHQVRIQFVCPKVKIELSWDNIVQKKGLGYIIIT